MTDYNDGKWHGWNGGECPVHPKTQIEAVWHDTDFYNMFFDRGEAGLYDWMHGKRQSELIRFRVITPYVEPPKPREWWINLREGTRVAYLHDTRRDADNGRRDHHGDICEGYHSIIHVREVLE